MEQVFRDIFKNADFKKSTVVTKSLRINFRQLLFSYFTDVLSFLKSK